MGAISTGLSADNIPVFAEDALPIIESKLTELETEYSQKNLSKAHYRKVAPSHT